LGLSLRADAFMRVANLKDMTPIEIKRQVRENNIQVIAKQMQEGGILVTEFIDRYLAEVLQENNVQFGVVIKINRKTIIVETEDHR
tara:strand:+ start:861 stop:1118 length:258 start_codon:yes stop_codon:yes gene_type:complete